MLKLIVFIDCQEILARVVIGSKLSYGISPHYPIIAQLVGAVFFIYATKEYYC